MIGYSRRVSFPIVAGPYSRRRWVRYRHMMRQIGMIALTMTAAGALFALAF